MITLLHYHSRQALMYINNANDCFHPAWLSIQLLMRHICLYNTIITCIYP